jgi:hypothetical protein
MNQLFCSRSNQSATVCGDTSPPGRNVMPISMTPTSTVSSAAVAAMR